jgi:hypothetical protein
MRRVTTVDDEQYICLVRKAWLIAGSGCALSDLHSCQLKNPNAQTGCARAQTISPRTMMGDTLAT